MRATVRPQRDEQRFLAHTLEAVASLAAAASAAAFALRPSCLPWSAYKLMAAAAAVTAMEVPEDRHGASHNRQLSGELTCYLLRFPLRTEETYWTASKSTSSTAAPNTEQDNYTAHKQARACVCVAR